MDAIFRSVTLLCSAVALILTILMLVSYWKERRFQALGLLISAALGLIMLPLFIVISGARLNIWIAAALLIIGGLIGFGRAFTVRFHQRSGQVVGKYSLLSLLGWGGSYALAIAMNALDSAVLASLGLAPLCFATGTQVALNSTLLLRRLLVRPPAVQSA